MQHEFVFRGMRNREAGSVLGVFGEGKGGREEKRGGREGGRGVSKRRRGGVAGAADSGSSGGDEQGWDETIEWFKANWLPTFKKTSSYVGLASKTQEKIDIQARMRPPRMPAYYNVACGQAWVVSGPGQGGSVGARADCSSCD